jgi:hypothetical protein
MVLFQWVVVNSVNFYLCCAIDDGTACDRCKVLVCSSLRCFLFEWKRCSPQSAEVEGCAIPYGSHLGIGSAEFPNFPMLP